MSGTGEASRLIRVLLADDQELVRTGFRLILDDREGIEVVGEARDGEEAVQRAQELRTDVVLMDIRMPRLDGIEATRRLVALPAEHRPHVLILTTFDLDEYVYEGLRAGSAGFLLKDCTGDELVHAIRVVASGEALLAPSVTRRLIDEFARRPAPRTTRPAGASLTERERDVLALMAQGLSNAEIGRQLVVSEPTVKSHVGHLLAKLELRNRVQAVVFAYEHGLVALARE